MESVESRAPEEEQSYYRERPKRLMDVVQTVQEIKKIKDKYKNFSSFPDKAVNDAATYLKQLHDFTQIQLGLMI